MTTYGAAINELENAGEVNLKLSMHSINKSEGSSTLTMTSTKNVCFVLDPPKNRDGKKRKAQCFQIMLTATIIVLGPYIRHLKAMKQI